MNFNQLINMFNKKTKENIKNVHDVVLAVNANLHQRIDVLVRAIDENGLIGSEVLEFLLDKSGYGFYEVSKLGNLKLKSKDAKVFEVRGIAYAIVKKSLIKTKKGKK